MTHQGPGGGRAGYYGRGQRAVVTRQNRSTSTKKGGKGGEGVLPVSPPSPPFSGPEQKYREAWLPQ
ncbi:MAG: hypothetical protein WCL71_15440 [Deltaproteobacteria bacterium]